ELFAEDLFQLAEPVADRLGVHGEAVGDLAGVAGTTEPAQKRFGEPLALWGAHRVERTESLPGEFVDEFLVVEEQQRGQVVGAADEAGAGQDAALREVERVAGPAQRAGARVERHGGAERAAQAA